MDRMEAAGRIEEIRGEVEDLVQEARDIAEGQGLDIPNLDAYVFDQINEHVDNGNKYNQSLRTIQEEIERGTEVEEGDSVSDRGNSEVTGEVIRVNDNTVLVLTDGEEEREVELPKARVKIEEKGPQ